MWPEVGSAYNKVGAAYNEIGLAYNKVGVAYNEEGVAMADLIGCYSGHELDEVGSEERANHLQDIGILWSWLFCSNCVCVCVCASVSFTHTSPTLQTN